MRNRTQSSNYSRNIAAVLWESGGKLSSDESFWNAPENWKDTEAQNSQQRPARPDRILDIGKLDSKCLPKIVNIAFIAVHVDHPEHTGWFLAL